MGDMAPVALWYFCLAAWMSKVVALCVNTTAITRKEWGASTEFERLAYINGVKCMQARPSKLSAICTACETAYDDFTAVHVNMTSSIHLSGIFYSWHRHYLYMFEDALQQHCGYPTHLGIPYWNWALPEYQSDLGNTTVFDGSPTSLSGNGILAKGGCVTDGPFANVTVRFGPFTIRQLFAGLPANWTQPNPRCLSRSLNSNVLRTLNNPTNLAKALDSPTIRDFQLTSDVVVAGGIHVGGHNAVGDTMRDIFCSPQDPAFFLHHSMLDRVWSMWQAADPEDTRRFTYYGSSSVGSSIGGQGNTLAVTNDTMLAFGILGEDMKIGELASPVAGPYCYQYV